MATPETILYGQTEPREASKIRWWVCGHGHVFSFGDQEWHFDEAADQGWDPDGPVPRYCSSEQMVQIPDSYGGGEEPCMDSSYLWGPFSTEQEAQSKAPELLANKF